MDIAPPGKRPAQESIVPMINVVFLLLIFFLMTSQIAPPDPVEMSSPVSRSGGEPGATAKLYASASGILYFEDLQGEAAFAALAGQQTAPQKLLLAADRGIEAAKLAAILRRLAAAGLPQVELMVRPQ